MIAVLNLKEYKIWEIPATVQFNNIFPWLDIYTTKQNCNFRLFSIAVIVGLAFGMSHQYWRCLRTKCAGGYLDLGDINISTNPLHRTQLLKAFPANTT